MNKQRSETYVGNGKIIVHDDGSATLVSKDTYYVSVPATKKNACSRGDECCSVKYPERGHTCEGGDKCACAQKEIAVLKV